MQANLLNLIEGYFDFLKAKHFKPSTIQRRDYCLRKFSLFLQRNNITQIHCVSRKEIEAYLSHLQKVKTRGKVINPETRGRELFIIRDFFSFLVKRNLILINPASAVTMPKIAKRLPVASISQEQIKELLSLPDVSRPKTLRDKAILELLFATGIRRMELCNLKWSEIDFKEKIIYIRNGKGGKDRLVPVSQRALDWLKEYKKVRANFKLAQKSTFVFSNIRSNRRPNPAHISVRMNDYFRQIGMQKGSCHLLRHNLATTMLNNGADLRYIQEILGHEDLATTQIYLKVSIGKLRDVHAKTHPLANLKNVEER